MFWTCQITLLYHKFWNAQVFIVTDHVSKQQRMHTAHIKYIYKV